MEEGGKTEQYKVEFNHYVVISKLEQHTAVCVCS
jgi:hypothetical protein